MTIEYRRARPEEYPAVAELDGANFGFDYSEQQLADARLDVDPFDVLAAVDGERIVGVSAQLPLQMTLPGGGLPVCGLTWVSVELTHRRRGILRALIERQLREQAALGCAAAVLTASEGGIYGRFGFGVATHTRRVVVDRQRARLRTPVDTSAVQRLTTPQARPLLPGLHERWRALTPGGLSRSEARWTLHLLDRPEQRHGMSGLFHLVHPDGYVSYRVKTEWADADPRNVCWLVDYKPVTDEAHAALWQTLLAMDLVATVQSQWVPLDDPLPHLLTDYRQVGTASLADGMWVRPLDVAALLSARTYAIEVDTVLEVADSLLGAGRYRLRGGPDGADCSATGAAADLTVDVAALGAAIAGGTRLAALARAGAVSGPPAALSRLDRALLGERLPAHGSGI